MIEESDAERFEEHNVNEVLVRSPVTCQLRYGICARCYGRDLGRGSLINKGEAVGVIAAQSIGEPGTQLTMRTFHIGGAASGATATSNIEARTADGQVKLVGVNIATNSAGRRVVMARSGELVIQDANGNDRERHRLPYGAFLNVEDGDVVTAGQVVAEWKPHVHRIVAEVDGELDADIRDGENITEQTDEFTGRKSYMVRDLASRGGSGDTQLKLRLKNPHRHRAPAVFADRAGVARITRKHLSRSGGAKTAEKGKPRAREMQLYIEIVPPGAAPKTRQKKIEVLEERERDLLVNDGDTVKKGQEIVAPLPFTYSPPSGSTILVNIKERVQRGDILVEIPQETKTRDITGGLPRVAELFEMRKPKEPAILAAVGGMVSFGRDTKGKQRLLITDGDGVEHEFLISKDRHILVHEGETVGKGEMIVDGQLVASDILELQGVEAFCNYIVNEIQDVYRLQGVRINDKHIEVIIRQMLRRVRVVDPGDSSFLKDEQVERARLLDENDTIEEKGDKTAVWAEQVLGITKASLTTESFISAASFQETTRVLIDASVNSKSDYMRGLKENVVVGRLIPAGSGLAHHEERRRRRETEVQDEQELQRLMSAAAEDGEGGEGGAAAAVAVAGAAGDTAAGSAESAADEAVTV